MNQTPIRDFKTMGALLKRSHPKIMRLLGWAIWLPFLMLVFWTSKYAVDFPFFDEWQALGLYLAKWTYGHLTFPELLNQHNESRKFFPRLILLPLARLTGWDTRYEIAISIALIGLSLLGMVRLLRRSFPSGSILGTIAGVAIFSAVCTPLQYDNLLWGLQMIMFVPPACLIGCLGIVNTGWADWQKLLGMLALAIVATLSFSNGLVLWIAMLLPLLWLVLRSPNYRNWWILPSWLVSFAITIALYFHRYNKPDDSPSLLVGLSMPANVVHYLLGFLGGPLGSLQLARSQEVGGFLVSLFLLGLGFTAWYGWRMMRSPSPFQPTALSNPDHPNSDPQTLDSQTLDSQNHQNWDWFQPFLPWITFGLYSFTSGTIAAVGRVGFGLEQSMAGRYVTVSTYFGVGLIGLVAVLVHSSLQRPWLFAGNANLPRSSFMNSSIASQPRSPWARKSYWVGLVLLGLWLSLQIPSYRAGIGGLKAFNRQLRLGKSCAVLMDVVQDDRCLEMNVFPVLKEARHYVELFGKLNYLHPKALKPQPLESFGIETRQDQAFGYWDKWDLRQSAQDLPHLPQTHPIRSADAYWVAQGWAALPNVGRTADVVILAQRDAKTGQHQPIALAWTGFERSDLAKAMGKDYLFGGWQTILTADQLPAEPTELSAWAFDTVTARAYKLPNTYPWPGREPSTPRTGTQPTPPQP